LHLITDGTVVKTDFGAVLTRGPTGEFRLGRKPVTLLADGRIGFTSDGETITYSPAPAYSPSQADLQAIVGRYHSDEAAADYVISMAGGALLMRVVDRPDSVEPLVPTYAGAFSWSGGEVAVRLLQAADGHVTGLRLSDDRVWDLRANRVE